MDSVFVVSTLRLLTFLWSYCKNAVFWWVSTMEHCQICGLIMAILPISSCKPQKKVFVTNKVYVVKTRAINNLEMCFDNVCVNFSDKAKVMPVVCLLIPELIIVFIYKSRADSEWTVSMTGMNHMFKITWNFRFVSLGSDENDFELVSTEPGKIRLQKP